MQLEYFSDTDTLYIQLKEGQAAETLEVAQDVVQDLNESGNVIGIELEHATDHVDLDSFRVSSLPVTTVESKIG